MIKKIGYLILVAVLMFAGVSTFFTSKVYAQGNTKVVLSTDKSYYNVGDTVKVTVQAQNAVDLFGVQFTLHYDPGMLSMEGNDFTFSDGYTVFGGSTVDKGKGILTYPVINKNPSPDNKDSVTVGYANFKASKEGPVTLNMDNIKSVNSQSVETNYNTQTQSVFNIAKAPDSTPGNNNPGNNNPGNNPNGGSNGSGNNNGGSAGNTNPGSSANNGGNSGSSSNNGNSGNGSSSSSGGNSYGSINSDSNNGGLTASADSNGNQAVNGNTNTASQSGNGNSTNQNTASNDTKNGAEGSTQNSSKNDTANKQTLDSNSKSPLSIILLIVVIVVVIGGAVFAFLNRKTLKDTFSKITNKKD